MSAAMRRACSKLVAVPNRGAGSPAVGQQFAEGTPVLGKVDRLGAGADDRHACLLQTFRQTERRLPAELHDHTDNAGTALARG